MAGEKNTPLTGHGLPLRILILDDEQTIASLLGKVLVNENCNVITASNVAEAESILNRTVPDIAIVDVYLGVENGLEFVRTVRKRLPEIAIVVISSEDTDTLATKAIDSGADSFLSKPIAPSALLLTVRQMSELREQRQRSAMLQRELDRSVRGNVFPEIVTHSDAMQSVLSLVEKVGPRDLAALICGESGTGKELIARAIHQISHRKKGNFVELNCAALPPNLVESELFGHEKGAFTGAIASRAGKVEQARGGTLFLDEIGELPLDIQPKFLRALQEKRITRVGGKGSIECDFRLVSATNRDLVEEIKAGRFREDLFYRVAVFPIKLPSLRERPEDLDLLLSHFLRLEDTQLLQVTPGAQAMLHQYPWPGNVRELKNFAQAISLLAEGGQIDEAAVRSYFGSRLETQVHAKAAEPAPAPVRKVRKLADMEREEILNALEIYKGNVSDAAEALGMGRATLYKYLKRHNIEVRAA